MNDLSNKLLKQKTIFIIYLLNIHLQPKNKTNICFNYIIVVVMNIKIPKTKYICYKFFESLKSPILNKMQHILKK